MAKLAAAKANKEADDAAAASSGPKDLAVSDANSALSQVAEPSSKSYQLPSAPCTFSFPAELGGPRSCMEGVLTTSDPAEIKYLDAAVRVGNVRYYDEHYKTRETTLPTPARKAQDQNNGIVL